MERTRAEVDGLHGEFILDSAAPDAASRQLSPFRRKWEEQLGNGFRLSALSPASAGRFRVTGRGAIVRDVAITSLYGASAIRTAGSARCHEDQVRMYVVRRGTWSLGDTRKDGTHTVSAGQFLIRRFGFSSGFETAPNTSAKILFLPSAMFSPLLAERSVSGSLGLPEMRLLIAHMSMVEDTLAALGPAGIHAARSTLIELARAVAVRRFDDAEPQLAPVIAQAAKELANTHLAHPELSPATLARELNISVRTLQRAFASTGESVAAYIRHRRLEEARLALAAPGDRLRVSELAAHWQFADSSHFIRAFKKHYGQTPTEYVRSTGPTGRARN